MNTTAENLERVQANDPSTDIGAMTMMLYGMPRPVEEVDAIAVLPGLGENWRIVDAIRAWNTSPVARHLLLAGSNPEQVGYFTPTLDNLSRPPFNLERQDSVHAQEKAGNAKDQAEWLTEHARELEVSSMALYVSSFHLLRGYGTVLKTLSKADIRIPIIPMPVSVSPAAPIPETGSNAWDLVSGEVQRIRAYQAKGDVATREELRGHIAWMWGQPPLASRDLASQV